MWGAILQDVRRASPDAILWFSGTLFTASPLPGLSCTYAGNARFVPANPFSGAIFDIFQRLAAILFRKLSISHFRSALLFPAVVRYPVNKS
jgi:hypothetical protein